MKENGPRRFAFVCRAAAALLLMPMVAGAATGIDEATVRGQVYLDGRVLPYFLRVVYEPVNWPGARTEDLNRRVRSITLTFDGRTTVFPKKAIAELYYANEPTPISPNYPDRTRGRFEISGGDGEKSFHAVFVISKKGLLQRKLYRHTDRPEVMRF